MMERWIDDLIHGDKTDVLDPDNAIDTSGLLRELRNDSELVEVFG